MPESVQFTAQPARYARHARRGTTPSRPTPRDGTTGQFQPAPDLGEELHVAETLAEIDALSRGPFRKLLSVYLQTAPDRESLIAQAQRNPDRWMQGLALLGRLAGFTEKLEVHASVDLHHVHHLSDAELDAEIARLDAQLTERPRPTPRLPPATDHTTQ